MARMSSAFFIFPGLRARDLALALILGRVILFFAVFTENIIIYLSNWRIAEFIRSWA